jgi:hypothetical protein
MSDTFATLIVTAADAPTSRSIAAAFGPGGVGMWVTPLSMSGQEPATHYISSGYISAEYVALSPMTTWELTEQGSWIQVSYYAGDAATVYAYASEAGLPYTLAEIEGVFSRSDVSAQEPFVALSRIGLKIINPPMGV